MNIKGFGKIIINKGNKTEQIDFTNAISTEFKDRVKGKFKASDNGGLGQIYTDLINKPISMKLILNNNTTLDEDNGTVAPLTRSSNTLTFKWTYDGTNKVYLTGATNDSTVQLSNVELKGRWELTAGVPAPGTFTFGSAGVDGDTYDYNDYVQEIEYNISFQLKDLSNAVLLFSANIAESVMNGSANNSIKPTSLKLYTDAAYTSVVSFGEDNYVNVDYSNGSISEDGLIPDTDDAPIRYKLFTGTDVEYDKGVLALDPVVSEELPWSNGDKINFQWQTDVFN